MRHSSAESPAPRDDYLRSDGHFDPWAMSESKKECAPLQRWVELSTEPGSASCGPEKRPPPEPKYNTEPHNTGASAGSVQV